MESFPPKPGLHGAVRAYNDRYIETPAHTLLPSSYNEQDIGRNVAHDPFGPQTVVNDPGTPDSKVEIIGGPTAKQEVIALGTPTDDVTRSADGAQAQALDHLVNELKALRDHFGAMAIPPGLKLAQYTTADPGGHALLPGLQSTDRPGLIVDQGVWDELRRKTEFRPGPPTTGTAMPPPPPPPPAPKPVAPNPNQVAHFFLSEMSFTAHFHYILLKDMCLVLVWDEHFPYGSPPQFSLTTGGNPFRIKVDGLGDAVLTCHYYGQSFTFEHWRFTIMTVVDAASIPVEANDHGNE